MDFRQKIFELRSYTPIPFIIVMLWFAHPTLWSLMFGGIFVLLGEGLRFWGVSILGGETRTTGPVGATHLATDGPFAYTRNPLYVGNMLIYVGVGIMSNALMPYLPIIALAFFIFQYTLIVSREEEHLQKVFGEEYTRYCENVPRFFFRFTSYETERSFTRSPELKRGIQSEMRTLQAIGVIIVVLIVRTII
mgnify:CR=1 FL=1